MSGTTSKIIQCGLIVSGTGGMALYRRLQGDGWWAWAFIAALFLPAFADGIGDFSKSRGGSGLPKFQRTLVGAASLLFMGVAVWDGLLGRECWFPLVLSLMLLIFAWTAGLPDPQPAEVEPSFDPNSPPQIPFEAALFVGSSADFTYYVNETFPITDWKDTAEDVLGLFLPRIPSFGFDVMRLPENTSVTVRLGNRSVTLALEPGPEAVQIIEPLACFLAPDFMLCRYRFTEGSDTWVNPVFPAALWYRLTKERPDRAALFTPWCGSK